MSNKKTKVVTFFKEFKNKTVTGFKNKSPKKKMIIITAALLVAVLIACIIVSQIFSGRHTADQAYIESRVTRGNIEVKIEGTGSAEPIDRYDIMPLVRGTILESVPEEGDEVKEGDVLYVIDHTDMDTNIEKTMNSYSKLQKTEKDLREKISNLTYYATASGVLSGFSLKEGETFSSNGGKIGEVTDTSVIIATVPFNRTQLDKIQTGQTATVNIEKYMQSVQGRVTDKSYVAKATGSGSVLYDVTIQIEGKNIAGIPENTKVTASISVGGETLISPAVGTTAYPDSKILAARAGGTVAQVLVKNGQWVTKGQKLVVFENDDLVTSLENNLLDQKDIKATLKSQNDVLEDYTITSPINGKVITKNYKKGDNLQESAGTTIMTVADMSKMKFYISADELDIAKIKIGQSVSVSADALAGVEFDAEVTQIATEGVSNNGVTTYQVEVTINNPEGLMPGMNVTGEIVVESAENVLMIPVSAVTARDGRYFVFVKQGKTDPTAVSAAPAQEGEGAQNREMPPMGERPEGAPTEGERPEETSEPGQSAAPAPSAKPVDRGEISERVLRQLEAAKPDGTEIAEITVGLSNDEFIEVTSGLSEGQTVVITGVVSETNDMQKMMMGGMPGGGMPSGGMPGGGGDAPGGGMR